ncbi:zinc finger protein 141-like isoform X2 [Stomoxys calcitrans]|uniref:zinc finger protein 141-like isoform X2 n=1 Tax=Stomoxys calcitrans TaxID=35570 RepID=UPI0027E36925|nr:zinc finger protein 141-like isoform X2 [Stomoxys calcitrans]
MIICGNIYLDEINKTFVMQCVICEKKSKAYTEFTKHIKKKHKTLDAGDQHQEDLVTTTPPPLTLVPVKREDDFDPEEYEEEKPLIQIKHEMEMEILEDLSHVKYDIIEPETAAVDPMALDEKETLDIAEITDDFDIKDEDYVPDNDSEDDCENYDEVQDGASSETDEDEEMPVSDKFNPTFFRKKRFINDFLDLYKSQPVLWDIKNPDFENPAARKEAERAMIRGMQKFNIYMKSSTLNRALNTVHKYCAIIKHNLETGGQKKIPDFTMGYYSKCEFLKDLIIKKNISGVQVSNKTKPLEFKETNETTTVFIENYAALPILYDGDNPSYGDVDGRQKALEQLSNTLKTQHNLDFNEDALTTIIEQLQSWYYNTKQRKENKNSKISKCEEKYYKRCKAFLPAERLRNRFICSVCKKNFNLRHNLQCHLYKIHQIGELPFPCDQCDRKFESKFQMHAHVQRIHVGKTYPCKFCDKKFAVPSELRIHTSIHSTEKPHTCELCGKSFRLKVQLGYHVTAIHTKIRAFKCNMCPKDFLKKRDLTDHIKSHLNIRDKICETCGKGFSNCHSLIRHRQIHSEVKKFACKLCDAKFHQFVGLNGHMKRTHNIVKKPA